MSTPRAYYNDTDPAAAHVLRHMIDTGVIAQGDVDTRSIKDVKPDDLADYVQCHFFAGGGLWSVAARLAGWPDSRAIWTGSCPCQPFSAAGKGGGTDDPRHLWPDFFRLIRACRDAGYGPPVVMGEQVSGATGYGWFDGVRADLASEGYASRTRDFPASAVDAPHQRNRLYWIAVADDESGQRRTGLRETGSQPDRYQPSNGNGACPACGGRGRIGPFFPGGLSTICGNCTLADHVGVGRQVPSAGRQPAIQGSISRTNPHGKNGTYWSGAEWITCHDGKTRRAKPGVRFLVDGLPGRVDLWRVGGNAIIPEAAAEVIRAFMDVRTAS